jgi:hypothetical protein
VVSTFRYPGRSVDLATGVATFDFTDGEHSFTETVTFPVPDRLPADLSAFHRVVDLLYVAIGTSYYKATAANRVALDGAPVAEKAYPWVTALYRHGLGEFAYRNDLPHVLDLDITGPHPTDAPPEQDRATAGPPLVPVGGGKDSIVSVETLRATGFRPVLFAVNPNPIIEAVSRVPALPRLAARRRLDRGLLELNAAGAYNGHIPVTAINSLVAVATAVLHGLGPVAMSNEQSASIANLTWHGRDINHQWSKGIEAEMLLRDALAAHAGLGNAYFSLLRGLSELRIAQLFARVNGYDPVVTSCNRAFKITDPTDRWCGECDKCRFIFLALAPFLSRGRLTGIFGTDLLADPAQLPGYRELCGLSAHKPFECVGETEECLVALRLAADSPEWTDEPVVRTLRAEVPPGGWPTDAQVARVLGGDGPNYVPPAFQPALDALAAA